MYLQEILEVATGLVFLWLVTSVAVMATQEWIANLFAWRSHDLEGAISRMLANPGLLKQFYDHQVIRGLSKNANFVQAFFLWLENLGRRIAGKPVKASLSPSYIPASDFAMTVFDIVMKAGTEASPIQKAFTDIKETVAQLSLDRMNFEDQLETQKYLEDILADCQRVANTDIGMDGVDSINAEIAHFAADHPQIQHEVNTVLLKQVNDYYLKLLEEQKRYPAEHLDRYQNIKKLRFGLIAMESTSPQLHQLLGSLFNGVEDFASSKEQVLAVARKNLEDWFDDAMAGLSGWYKRKSQIAGFIIGLILAVLLNVDSIYLASRLWKEPTLRQEVVAQADAYAQANATLPQGSTTPLAPQKSVAELSSELTALNIPFGWQTTAVTLQPGQTCEVIPIHAGAVWGMWSGGTCKQVTNTPVDATGWLGKIAGILITALATMQGAPFWFDVLKKIVNVRSTGPNPAEDTAAG